MGGGRGWDAGLLGKEATSAPTSLVNDDSGSSGC